MKPLIGLTPTPEHLNQEHGTFRLNTLSENYSRSVELAGGMPVMIPAHIEDVPELLDNLDAVIITGGGDVDPAHYGQEPHAKTNEIDAVRDAFEIAIVHEAIKRDMPLLGICRGLQVLNVALGGTLNQHLGELTPTDVQHRQQDDKIHHETPTQTVNLTEGENPLRDMVGSDEIQVNTFHHQGIDSLAESLRPIAISTDGLIEAVYHYGLTYGLAVQWHPEMLASTRADAAAIFRSLTEAATTFNTQRKNREAAHPV